MARSGAFSPRRRSPLKKILRAAEQDIAAEPARRQEDQKKLNAKRLVFIDEKWVKTNMAPTHGRWRRGERLYAKVPHGRWKTTTFVTALRHDGMTAPFVLDGPINGEWFLAFVETVLVPSLLPGDIVLLDHLGAHTSPKIRKAIEAKNAELRFLPRYPPDHRDDVFEIEDASYLFNYLFVASVYICSQALGIHGVGRSFLGRRNCRMGDFGLDAENLE
jgi:DDE superfamily endonuclease